MPMVFIALMLRALGALVTTLSLWLVLEFFGVRITDAYSALIIVVALLAIIILPGPDIDRLGESISFSQTTVPVIWNWTLLLVALLFLGYVTKTSSTYSRSALLTWSMATPIALAVIQYFLVRLIVAQTRFNQRTRRVVIAGFNDRARLLAEKIRSLPSIGMSLDGYFDDRSEERLGAHSTGAMLGRLLDLPSYVKNHRTDIIYIALPMRNISRVTELLDELHDTTASIYYVPDVFVFDLIQCRTDSIDGLPVIALCETPFFGVNGTLKRMSDIAIAAFALVLTAPLLILIAIALKLTSNDSVIFKQRRYGLDGHEITVYKFRTMTVTEDSGPIKQATKNDNRVTRIGALLRRYSLDELPQFFNVLQGRMSVVGPRPHAVAQNEEYRKLIKGYMIRHKVNPGITGLAQVTGHRGETATVGEMQKRVEADLEYLRNWSLDLDIKIILRTIAVMFSDKKAY